MEEIIEFIKKYKYPIVGAIIAILVLITDFYKVLVVIALIVLGAYIGYYFQTHKESVKEKLRKIIDKM